MTTPSCAAPVMSALGVLSFVGSPADTVTIGRMTPVSVATILAPLPLAPGATLVDPDSAADARVSSLVLAAKGALPSPMLYNEQRSACGKKPSKLRKGRIF